MSLRPLLDLAAENERVHALASRVRAGEGESVRASTMLRPLLLASLLEDDRGLAGRPALLVGADDRSARDLAADLRSYLGPRRVRFYPSRGTGYASHVSPPPHLVGLRIDALDALGREEDAIVVASATALAEAVPDASLRPAGFALELGEEIDLDAVAGDLVGAGYERVEQVEERGQFAVRGGILDVYPATEERAVRIELFGDEIESMRWFSTFTQRSLGDGQRVELAPAAEMDAEHRELAELAAMAAEEEGTESPNLAEVLPLEHFRAPLELVPEGAAVVLVGSDEIEPALRDHWEDATTAMHADDAQHLYVDVAEPLSERAALAFTGAGEGQEEGEEEGDEAFRAARAESPARSIKEAEGELEKLIRSGYRTVVAFDSRGEAERARYGLDRLDARLLEGGHLSPDPGLSFAEARLREGFVSPELKLAVYPFRRLVHRRRSEEPAPGAGRGRLAFSELRVGDYVVHEDHGVARFAGFETREVGGVTRDYLYLEYKGEDRVYVPTDQLAKLSRYVGAGGEPTLSALGGKRWQNMKARARKAAGALAGELLNLYAERRFRKGHAFPPDGEWQIAMETAFPYRETADQVEAIEAVKGDMESERPMDRLVCGDVGFGKTEVALRAAVKAASDGKQVMVLVPTTILAQQHFGTFRERLADLPFRVEGVSRLRPQAEVKAILKDFGAGKVDVLIGTHRLLSRDVRAKDLGLVVVDEEQRFGVKQKELLRQLKLKVDVLALSATPIPRTLQMSLAGLRDISVIETPPEGRRPVRTYVGPYDEDLVGKAIRRELERKGQAFVLHNRIDSLPETTERLRALVPGARFLEAHGQMDEHQLEETMLAFLRGDADVLVTTTIIESGLDIPTANTLIVERADQLGLSQAYQIRGRVGRSRERAFAYLLYPSAEALTEEAAARLSTLADHTELGSGFRIAMRDLDIRGAGNLLGDEQSGHVAAVGFELYCQMIDEAVAEAAGADGEAAAQEEAPEPVRLDVPVDAYLPASYVPFEAAKIDIHRRIVAAREPGQLRAIRDELEDRFGPLPAEAENLLKLQQARIQLGLAGARSVEFRGGRLTVTGVELDSGGAAVLSEQVEGALYEWREQTAALRVDGDPSARLEAVLAMAEGLREARREAEPATA
ncbi:MAG TPA: transcription-repair coupling factor [Solirubrobacterales bacterium]|jgi:transcription-repair coupling factor (superfamily II helicase)|nr:transcription-repair coupling factor [Solirubrobacterales bacterium]